MSSDELQIVQKMIRGEIDAEVAFEKLGEEKYKLVLDIQKNFI